MHEDKYHYEQMKMKKKILSCKLNVDHSQKFRPYAPRWHKRPR